MHNSFPGKFKNWDPDDHHSEFDPDNPQDLDAERDYQEDIDEEFEEMQSDPGEDDY